jgi:hypothetical protein
LGLVLKLKTWKLELNPNPRAQKAIEIVEVWDHKEIIEFSENQI